MLTANQDKSRVIINVFRQEDSLFLVSEHGVLRLTPKNTRTIRVTYTNREKFSDAKSAGVVAVDNYSDWLYEESERYVILKLSELFVRVCKNTGSCRYYNESGKLLFAERDFESKELESFTMYSLIEESAVVEEIRTADGVKNVVQEAKRVPVDESFHTRLNFTFQEKECIYGLGQHEEGFGSLRGNIVYVHQANRKIAIPFLISNLGYGILMDTYSPMIFSDTDYGTYIYSEASAELDFYFINGGSMSDTIKEYRFLTGKAAMLPKWAFGYIQSQERYESQEEILAVAEEFRRRSIGIDGLVQDWISWEEEKWGQKSFDLSRYPSPEKMTEKLHDMNIHLMLSIWANPGETSDDYKEFSEAGYLLPVSNIYNAYLPQARAMYWRQANEGLFSKGIDAWWCDNSEPYTPEWNVSVKPEPSKLYMDYCRDSGDHLPYDEMNAYAFYHAMGVFEGQRSTTDKKRVFNLTRSGYTGQQRYGTVLWSGDISANWDTFRRQIAAGLGFSASGLPYWTVDIGAFFVKNSDMWYWKGDYNKTNDDMGYVELFTRWYQWGAFLPVFRGHGTDCRRELWYFKKEDRRFYEALIKANRLRYELMPYIYSHAGRTWLDDESMMRFLAFDYPDDETACAVKDQYLFGDSIMVCPVTEPMYYGVDSAAISCEKKVRQVYLPKGLWYDFYTEKAYQGGAWIEAEADIDRIPLFVKAGAIIPMAHFLGSTESQKEIDYIKVFAGCDGVFKYYTDAGDGYGYENGEYCCIIFTWRDEEKQFFVSDDGLKDITVHVIQHNFVL